MVALIDTGVDARHPDLEGAVLPGIDLVTDEPNAHADISGHGTAMAGLIGARGRANGSGALGIAPKAKILPVRDGLLSSAGGRLADGINAAIRLGADVICIASGNSNPSFELETAIAVALRHDIVMVAASGNRPNDENVIWPAAYPGVIAAAGVDRNGNHADVSVTGPEVVLAAPAVDIVSTDKLGESGYRKGTGTSDATAIIAGAAALVRAEFPELSAAEVVHRLTATAVDKGPPGRDEQYGYGVLNLYGALTADVPDLDMSSTEQAASEPPIALSPPDPPDQRRVRLGIGYMLVGLVLLAAVVVGAFLVSRRRRL